MFLAFFCQHFSYAQSERIDSLKKGFLGLKGAEKVDRLNSLSEGFKDIRLFDSSRIFALHAVNLSKQIQYETGLGDALMNLAAVDYERSKFAMMEKESNQSIAIFKKIHAEKRLAKAYVLLGSAVWTQSKFDQAKEAFNKANHYFIQFNDSIGLARTYTLMASAEEERGNYEESFQYCVKALKLNYNNAFIPLGQLYADVGDYETALDYYRRISPRAKMSSYLKIGETYFLQQRYDSAMYYYHLYITSGISQSPKMLTKAYALLGGLYVKLKNYDIALFYLNNALKDFKEDNDRNWTMRVLMELGKMYKETGDRNAAIKTIQELLAVAQESGARQYTRDAHYWLYRLYDAMEKNDGAYHHLRKYTALNNEIAIDLSARKLTFYKTSHERAQTQLKIALLNKQKQLQLEELKQTSQQRTFLVIGLLAIVFIGIVLVRNSLLKRREEKHLRELAENDLCIQKLETKKQLGDLEMQVLRTQMNPHFIFNSLNSINRFILQNNKVQASQYLTKFSRLVRMILQNSQNELITLEQELESLELYLSLEALRFDDHFTYTITVEKELDVSSLNVPPLIIQPYAENAIWHGLMHKEEKGDLQINVFMANECLFFKIMDNGIGRQKATTLRNKLNTAHKSMGLTITAQRIARMQEPSTQEAAVLINDLIEADGTPCGTEVILKLPLIYD